MRGRCLKDTGDQRVTCGSNYPKAFRITGDWEKAFTGAGRWCEMVEDEAENFLIIRLARALALAARRRLTRRKEGELIDSGTVVGGETDRRSRSFTRSFVA